jgi:AraC-like DNA-binding protein
MEQIEQLQTINYAGIFFSCYSAHNTTCIHSIQAHSINYVSSGEQIIEDGNNKITISAGEAAFVRRNHRTRIYKNGKDGEGYKGVSLVFDRNVLRNFYSKLDKANLPRDISIEEKNVFRIAHRPDIKSLFQSLTPYFDENLKPTEAIAHLKLLEGIYVLLNTADIFYQILFDFTDPWKVDILEFLNDNYMDDLSMEQIAMYTGRSLATFKRDFNKISSLSPQKWLIKKRLETAYVLLKEDGKKVQDVYVEVGFKNPSHFSTAFKKQYGIPPTDV